ncbi:MAG TPA: 2-oxoacid:acceptor oxidoreductase [Acholeplasmataceae bacterium]|nr:2-oxoacid:acceptor oxidoreductase [Acholeplasmataceae bacterium]
MSKYLLEFKDEFCKGCELCVSQCPVKILELSRERFNQSGYALVDVVDINRCIGCTFCAIICPDAVIKVIKNG